LSALEKNAAELPLTPIVHAVRRVEGRPSAKVPAG
jgi:hypothetical protein